MVTIQLNGHTFNHEVFYIIYGSAEAPRRPYAAAYVSGLYVVV